MSVRVTTISSVQTNFRETVESRCVQCWQTFGKDFDRTPRSDLKIRQNIIRKTSTIRDFALGKDW